jgi:hypothetical protein
MPPTAAAVDHWLEGGRRRSSAIANTTSATAAKARFLISIKLTGRDIVAAV